jgi:hypothetical protein
LAVGGWFGAAGSGLNDSNPIGPYVPWSQYDAKMPFGSHFIAFLLWKLLFFLDLESGRYFLPPGIVRRVTALFVMRISDLCTLEMQWL